MKYEDVVRLVEAAKRSNSPSIDIEASAAVDELRNCEVKMVQTDTWGRPYWHQLCKYKDEWWSVGHTSLFDDVATGLCAVTPEEQTQTVQNFLSKTQFGVRFHRWKSPEGETVGALSFITHMTDG